MLRQTKIYATFYVFFLFFVFFCYVFSNELCCTEVTKCTEKYFYLLVAISKLMS